MRATVSDWTALAGTQADIDAYRAALGGGTLDGVQSFEDAMTGLPAEALVRGWVDLARPPSELASAFEQPARGELGVDWLAAALAAEEDGVHLSLGVRTPDGNGSSYEPELVERVPADAVAALSFGGTQGVLDRIEGTVDVGEISKVLQDTIGVSLDGLLDALSGEGLLYVRKGGAEVPEVTLVLAPPDRTRRSTPSTASSASSPCRRARRCGPAPRAAERSTSSPSRASRSRTRGSTTTP